MGAFVMCAEFCATGKGCAVDLFVAHHPCVSCAAAMCNMTSLLPHLQLHVDFRDWTSMQRSLNIAVSHIQDDTSSRVASLVPQNSCDDTSQVQRKRSGYALSKFC